MIIHRRTATLLELFVVPALAGSDTVFPPKGGTTNGLLRVLKLAIVAITFSVSLTGFAIADDGDQPHAVILVGTLHYSPELTMPVFANELERFGFRTTLVMGKGDPEKKTEDVLPGIDALADADLAIFFMRFLKLPDDQTLVLGMEDGSPTTSGDVTLEQYGAGDTTGPAFLTIAAYADEQPVVSGGIPVNGWQKLATVPAGLPAEAAGKVWIADIPTGLKRFHTLYDARGRLNRARGDGFLPTKNGDSRTLHFPAGKITGIIWRTWKFR